jgi:hypothetical protein
VEQTERARLLSTLDFGRVDAESESDLDRRFVRTSDFVRFINPEIQLLLGAKGTGKSAIFDLFARFEPTARSLAESRIDDVVIVTGTGLSDLHEVATGDLDELTPRDGYDAIWRLYVAVKTAFALEPLLDDSSRSVRGLLRAAGELPDRRIGPLLKGLWTRLVSGDTPGQVGFAGVSVGDFEHGALDVTQLLHDADSLLERRGKRAWILFDKVDELFPSRPAERKLALEGLLAATMSMRRTFPRIQPRVFLRTDLWAEVDLTNKTHLVDKLVTLSWTREQLARLLVKGAMTDPEVRAYVRRRAQGLPEDSDLASDPQIEAGLQALMPATVYPGTREAGIVDWIYARVTDARGTAFPRETIYLGNRSRDHQIRLGSGGTETQALMGREAVRAAFTDVSVARCQTYLAEFPSLRPHFARFQGKTKADFSREEVDAMMEGLRPGGVELLTELFEVGVLRPVDGPVTTAARFEIPRLYRQGLGLVIRGRP